VPAGTNEEFRRVVSHLGELRAITFPRAAKPKEEVLGKPMLLIFGDGLTMASCALAYLRWQMADGTVQCRLLAGGWHRSARSQIPGWNWGERF